MTIPVSVLILTRNEEENLPLCLASVKWCDDIVVYDSFSTDRTVDVAEAVGARIYKRWFDNFGCQREAARTQISYKHPWVLALDVDEQVDEQLLDEMDRVSVLPQAPRHAYRMRRKDFLLGQWIKHDTLGPDEVFFDPCFFRTYECFATELMRAVLLPGDTMFDIGSNFGWLGLPALAKSMIAIATKS